MMRRLGPLTVVIDVLALGLAAAALAPSSTPPEAGGALASIRHVLFGRLAPLTALISALIAAAAFARILAKYRKTSGLPWRAGFVFLLSCVSLIFALEAML